MATASPLKGRPATTEAPMQRGGRLQPRSPCKGAVDCDKAPCKGAVGCGKAPCKGAAGCGQANLQGCGACPQPDRKGSHQRVAGCSAVPTRGDSHPRPHRRGCCQWFGARRKAAYGQRQLPQGLPPARAVACSGSACRGDAYVSVGRRGGHPLAEWLLADKDSRRLCRGSSDNGGAVRVKEC
ncbi:hypothetical protein GW17_00029777 [Ensete ventricosum]|nr:hypothetical protein GW17_00029777 [Ensete ventricosum]